MDKLRNRWRIRFRSFIVSKMSQTHVSPNSPQACGVPMRLPSPTCTLRAGHEGNHQTTQIPESLSGIVAEENLVLARIHARERHVATLTRTLQIGLGVVIVLMSGNLLLIGQLLTS